MKIYRLFSLLLVVISINAKSQTDTLTAYPNPFDTTFHLNISLVNNDTVNITMYNLIGQLEKTITTNSYMPTGNHNITVNCSTLSSGVYFVKMDANGQSIAKKVIKTNTSNGIEAIVNETKTINVYPNPSDGSNVNIDFQAPTNTNAQLVVYDMMGRAVYTNNLNDRNEINSAYSLDVSGLASGVYMVNLVIDKVKVCQKLIKN